MKIIDQSHEILRLDGIDIIERAGRVCYKSEDKIGCALPEDIPCCPAGEKVWCGICPDATAAPFTRGLAKKHHEAMLEHGGATVKFTTNRGVTHELVRHRLASFAQESTRYCDYSKGKFGSVLTFIRPVWCSPVMLGTHTIEWFAAGMVGARIEGQLNPELSPGDNLFFWSCATAERDYKWLLDCGWPPEQAREVLTNALKTEIVVTANYREWCHILKLRAVGTTGRPHPQMSALMLPLLAEFRKRVPAVFDDNIFAGADEP